jgi:hypothetical protein
MIILQRNLYIKSFDKSKTAYQMYIALLEFTCISHSRTVSKYSLNILFPDLKIDLFIVLYTFYSENNFTVCPLYINSTNFSGK